MTQNVVDEKKAKSEAVKARTKEMDAREKALNEGKTGVGTRTQLAMTRGKGTTEIQYEAWDETQPETLPKTLTEFMDYRSDYKEPEIVRRLIVGDNELAYMEASDPIAEFVESSWDDDLKTRFRTIIRNYVAAVPATSIEDAVTLIKPGIVAGYEAMKAAKAAEVSK